MKVEFSKDLLIERTVSSKASNMAKMHEHSNYEIYFLLSGRRRYLMRDTVYDIEPGNLMLIPKNVLHRTASADGTGYDRFVVYFSGRQEERLKDLLGEEVLESLFLQGCLTFSTAAEKELCDDLHRLYQSFTNPTPYSDAVNSNLLQKIILSALQNGIKKERLSGENAEKIQSAARYVSRNFNQELSLASVAKTVGFEKTYFSKLFKTYTGFGFQDYLLQTRILEAERLLKFLDYFLGVSSESLPSNSVCREFVGGSCFRV